MNVALFRGGLIFSQDKLGPGPVTSISGKGRNEQTTEIKTETCPLEILSAASEGLEARDTKDCKTYPTLHFSAFALLKNAYAFFRLCTGAFEARATEKKTVLGQNNWIFSA